MRLFLLIGVSGLLIGCINPKISLSGDYNDYESVNFGELQRQAQEECEKIKPDSYPAHVGTWFEDEEGTVTYECLPKPLVGTTDLFLGVIRGTMVLY